MKVLKLFLITVVLAHGIILSQSTRGVIKGFVVEKHSLVSLAGANLFIEELNIGSAANIKGYYELNIPGGDYNLHISIVGYKSLLKRFSIKPGEKKEFIFELEPEAVEIDQVVVEGKSRKIEQLDFELLQNTLKAIPHFGEADPLRALFSLPGISSSADWSSNLYVRGGNFYETMIAIDEVPIYNPYHLGGVFSSINPDIVDKENIFISNYPVNYNGYLSGIVDVSTFNGKKEYFQTSAYLSFLSSKIFINGPVGGGNLLLGYRRSYLDIIAKIAMADLPYYFDDLFAQYKFQALDKLQIKSFVYQSSDHLENYSWGNFLFNLEAIYELNKDNFITAKVFQSASNVSSNKFLTTDELDNNYIENDIEDNTFSLKLENTLGRFSNILGFEIKNIDLNYDWDVTSDTKIKDFVRFPADIFYDFAPTENKFKMAQNILSLYAQTNFYFLNNLSTNLGVRGTKYSKIGNILFSPFVSVKYNPYSFIGIKASYAEYHQNLYTFKELRTEDIFSPSSVYVLPESRESIPYSQNFTFEISLASLPFNTEFTAETYYKKRFNLPAAYYDLPRYRFDDGYAAGIDLQLRKTQGKFNGWIAYSFSRSIYQTINDFSYYSSYDRKHNVKIFGEFALSSSIKFSALWSYASPLPITKAVGRYIGGIDFADGYAKLNELDWNKYRLIYAPKNSERFEPTHRLDIGLTGKFVWGRTAIYPFFQIINVYNSPNYYAMDYGIYFTENKKAFGSFIIPSLGVKIVI